MSMVHAPKSGAQAAVDFITSYGLVLLVLIFVFYAVLSLGIFNLNSVPLQCVSNPSFSCSGVLLNVSGNITFTLTQAVGGTIVVNGEACSTTENSTNSMPAYGNLHVVPKISETGVWYQSSDYSATMASGSSAVFKAVCFGPAGADSGNLGQVASGFLWINYTDPELPSGFSTVVRVAQFTAKYS